MKPRGWVRLSVAAAAAATAAALTADDPGAQPQQQQQPPEGFLFPQRVRWTYSIEIDGGVRGSGVGMADWTRSSRYPRYFVNETFEASTLLPAFRIVSSTVAGPGAAQDSDAKAAYRFRYTTQDGSSACLPAPVADFGRAQFSPRTHTKRVRLAGVDCNLYEAVLGSGGAPGSVELLTCAGVPQQTVWRGAKGGPRQVSRMRTFDAVSPAGEAAFTAALDAGISAAQKECAAAHTAGVPPAAARGARLRRAQPAAEPLRLFARPGNMREEMLDFSYGDGRRTHRGSRLAVVLALGGAAVLGLVLAVSRRS